MDAPFVETAGLSDLRQRIFERIAGGGLELPMLPETATQVLAICGDQACDSRRLAELIHRDAGLTSQTLRIANSAAYAPRERIVSVHQAVSRLGFHTVCEISVAAAMKGRVFSAPGEESRLRVLWSHCAVAGTWAKEIGRQRRRNVEGAFVCGLLHDIGKLALLPVLVELRVQCELARDPRLVDAVLLEFHAFVGAEVLVAWSLPDWMTAAIHHHHDPDRAGPHADFARTAQLADLLAHVTVAPDPEVEAALRTHPVLGRLGLYTDEFDLLLARRDQVLVQSKAFL
jgi:putative nucleotidyltransferase with HDIG domain